MDTRALQAFLRVLYTVNNNPQYILAKSSAQVRVVACGEVAMQLATDEPAYARAPLKACLAVVCDSSPELLQDPTRDFSLYFLDPLETQPLPTGLTNTAHDTNSPRGVAVALGLMSWALESHDSANVYVTGTIVPNVPPALEIVCALRETKRMPKPILHSYPPLGSVSAPGLYPPAPPQTSGVGWASTFYSQYNQQQQKTLTRSADFPELYIGPPRRGRGRPEGSASSKSKVKAHANASAPPGNVTFGQNDQAANTIEVAGAGSAVLESKQGVERGPKQKTKPRPPRPPPTHSPFICAPLIRNADVAGSGVRATNAPVNNERSSRGQNLQHAELHRQHFSSLLELISSIPSTIGEPGGNPTPEQQAALISALQGLLVANPHLLQPTTTSEGLPANIGGTTTQDVPESSNAGSEHGDGDPDIVILDSSTIDTTIFRKSNTRQQATGDPDASSLAVYQESPWPSNDGMDSSPLPASTPFSVQENMSVSSQASTPSDALESTSTVTANRETPKHDSLGWTGRDNGNTSRPLEIPATPTPSRTRKRKLDEYSQGQAHWSTPPSPPPPSPSVTRMSSSGRPMAAERRGQSSPTGGTMSISSPSMRLPSMLDSMRGTTVLGSRMQDISADPSMHGHSASRTVENNGKQPTILSKPKAEHDTTSDASLLKRRRTLSEFMEEHEARKNAKAQKQSSAHKPRTDVSVDAPSHKALLRPTKVGSTSRHAQSSPSRPLFRSALQFPTSTSQSGVMSNTVMSNPASAPTTTLASTGPSLTATQMKNPLKNFVMPAWARTSTALLPRLSEEALARQQAEREAKKGQAALRRRETAKAKRKQLHADRPSKDSSDENDETIMSVAKRTLPLCSSSVVQNPVPQPPPTLPVFASDTVAPVASSPHPIRNQPVLPAIPSTPPRKPISLSGPASHRTPTKSGFCSLFTPSGQDGLSLFTPSTPSVTRSQTGARFTPRSPTLLRCSGGKKKSPWKNELQTPRTPRRNVSDHPTPGSLGTNRYLPFRSPSTATRTPQTQTGMGTRAFLLPPSPCAPRTPQRSKRESVGTTPIMLRELGLLRQMPVPGTRTESAQQKDGEDEDVLGRELDAFLREDATVSPTRCHPSWENSQLDDINVGSDADLAEEDYTSSPLPPSSPLPASPLSSPGPAKHDGGMHLTSTENNAQRATDPTATWFTDSEAGAWFTETEAWLTDTEGGPLPTDSDGAWLSDSDAVSSAFGRLGTSLSNWPSDEINVEETDAEVAVFDTAAFQRAYAALVDRGGANVSMDGASSGEAAAGAAATHGDGSIKGAIEPGFWESIQPLLVEGGAALNGAGTVSEVAHEMQALLDGLVDT